MTYVHCLLNTVVVVPYRAFLVSFSLILTYLNYRGLHLVGNMAVAMAIFTLVPFVVMCIMGKMNTYIIPTARILNNTSVGTVQAFPA